MTHALGEERAMFMFVLEIVATGVLLVIVWLVWHAWRALNQGAADAYALMERQDREVAERRQRKRAWRAQRSIRQRPNHATMPARTPDAARAPRDLVLERDQY